MALKSGETQMSMIIPNVEELMESLVFNLKRLIKINSEPMPLVAQDSTSEFRRVSQQA